MLDNLFSSSRENSSAMSVLFPMRFLRVSLRILRIWLRPIDGDCGFGEVTEQKPGHSGGIWDRWPSGCEANTSSDNWRSNTSETRQQIVLQTHRLRIAEMWTAVNSNLGVFFCDRCKACSDHKLWAVKFNHQGIDPCVSIQLSGYLNILCLSNYLLLTARHSVFWDIRKIQLI